MESPAFDYINPRYLSGVVDEPKQLLQPISGYAHEPLLPLEEACQPLIPIVPRLLAHVWVAKQNSKNPADGLTQDESAAIRLYTMEWDAADHEPRCSLYTQLNQALKLIDRTKLRPWFRFLKLFLTALAKLPPAPRQTVWRGVRKNYSDDYEPGSEATWWAFSSCSTSLSVLESDLYLGNTGTRTLFSIETFNGRAIRAHSHFQTEDEILLLPGTYLEVKSRLNPAPDLFIVHLTQKRPPFDLLEPPFKGAELVPCHEPRRESGGIMRIYDDRSPNKLRPWYKKKNWRWLIAIAIIAILLALILGAALGSQTTRPQPLVTTTTAVSLMTSVSSSSNSTSAPVVGFYRSGPIPVYITDVFYAFDGNTNDLYSRRNGEVIGGPATYIQGYVPYGQAIDLDQSNTTYVQIQPGLLLDTNTSFTVEGFFLLRKTLLNSTLVQFTPVITMNIIDGVLSMSLGSNHVIISNTMISTDQWHHFSFVYNAIQQTASIYIDGIVDITRTSVIADVNYDRNNSFIIVGNGFAGYIDQLAISLKAKSPAVILWDATVAGYYPMSVSYLLDLGPNGLNATASSVLPVIGWRNKGLNFNLSHATFQANGFTVLGEPRHSFSITLWVRAEAQAGVFLTVANSYTCLLILGLQSKTNRLILYMPGAPSTNGITVFGPIMPSFRWVHVALTWSITKGAVLYTSGYLQSSAADAKILSNTLKNENSAPMSVTLGYYNGPVKYPNMSEIDSSQQFTGSLDELYVFSRELQENEINDILTP